MTSDSLKKLDSSDLYTIAWIAALSIERAAAEAMLDEEHDEPTEFIQHRSDTNSYTWGRIGEHNIVIVSLTDGVYGLASAGTTASNLSSSLPAIRVGLLVGIGGGIARPDEGYDIRLGDVVVSRPDGTTGGVCQYDLVKAKPGDIRERKGFLAPPPRVLLNALTKIRAFHERRDSEIPRFLQDMLEANPKMAKRSRKSPGYSHQGVENDRLFQSLYEHVAGQDCCSCETAQEVEREERESTDPEIHYGIIASGNTLVKDAVARDRIVADVGEDCICFEMEAAGLMNHFPCLVIRGICDYADSHKNDRWQRYASATAAGYAKELMRYLPAAEIQNSKSALEILESVNERVATTQQTTLAMKATVDHMVLDSQGQKIRTWLAAPDPSINANHARELRQNGTGSWILENTAFRNWKSGTYKHLWLRGMAGCGKTVLTTTVLDDLAKNPEQIILSFFFDFRDAMKQTKNDLMRSLAFQLYQGGYDSAGRLECLFRAHENRNERLTTTTLDEIIKVILAAQKKVVIVLDALDESTTREEVLLWLKGIFHDREHGHVQILYTSREEAEFIRHIPGLIGDQCCLSLDVRATTADIRSYVIARTLNDTRLTEKGLSEDLLRQIHTKVGDGAKGMFRWAACQLDSLGECLSPREVQKALDSLPSTLAETYGRMLERIPRDYYNNAVRLLRFIVHVKRPLTLGAAVDIIATEVEEEHPRFDVNCRMFHVSDVLRHCPSLVSVIEVKDGSKTGHELHLAHFSVKEYLLLQGDFGQMDASITITKTCLTYLRDIDGSRWKLAKEFPLAGYAARVFMDFAAVAEASNEVSTMMIEFFRSKDTFNRWKYLSEAELPYTDSYGAWISVPLKNDFRRGSVLYFACLLGLGTVARSAIDAGASVNSQWEAYGNTLSTASYHGHLDIVQLLLDNHADINSQDGDGRTPLQVASRNGHLDVVQLLLDSNADINARDVRGKSALQKAVYQGHFDITRLLLDRNADINARDDQGKGVLHEAACGGHVEIVQLLLDKKANLQARDNAGYSALDTAALYGRLSVVALLLDKNEDASVQSSLIAASGCGCLKIVELLLDKHANEDVQQPLITASLDGDLKVVELLLHRHATADVHNALITASKHGHLKIVELLLDHVGDINEPDGFEQTVLDAAISGSHLEVILLLLKNGADLCKQSVSHHAAAKLALESGHHELAHLLLDVKSADIYGTEGVVINSLLPCAAISGKQDLVQLVLDIGADINATSSTFRSALEEACFHGHESIVKTLLELGADVNGRPGSCGGPLQAAILSGNENVVNTLREFDAELSLVADNLAPILHEASCHHDTSIVRLLADLGLDIPRIKNNDQRIAQQLDYCLGLACLYGKNDLVKAWADVGANVNGQSREGNHIQAACLGDRKDTIQVLVGLGADINNVSRRGSALKTTVMQGNAALVEMLLDLNADVNIDESESSDWVHEENDSEISTPLSAAASKGNLEVAALLVAAGADVDAPRHGHAWAPLAFASWMGHIEMVDFLLEKGADVSFGGRCGYTALFLASDAGHLDVVKLLLEKGANPITTSLNGWTPLSMSSYRGHAEIVLQLIDISGIHPYNQHPTSVMTALSYAAEQGHKSAVELLLRNSQVDVNSKDPQGWTALCCAAGAGHKSVVEILLNVPNINVDSKDFVSRTALSYAAERGYKSVVELLLNVPNIDVNSKDFESRTAFSYAAGTGHQSIVELLLNVPNININSKDSVGRTALYYAAERGHMLVVQLMLKDPNIDIDSKDFIGRAALFTASAEGHDAIVDILLKHNARADLADRYGTTPLSVAARQGHMRVIEILLALGATSTSEDHFGRMPIWWAKKCGKFDVLRVLAPSETQQPQATDSGANTGSFVERCTVCVVKIPRHHGFYICPNCSGGSFRICRYCWTAGARCLQNPHREAFDRRYIYTGSFARSDSLSRRLSW